MPGCEKLELVDGSYLGEIKVKVGPIQGKFSGKVDLLDQVPPHSYRMLVDGAKPPLTGTELARDIRIAMLTTISMSVKPSRAEQKPRLILFNHSGNTFGY